MINIVLCEDNKIYSDELVTKLSYITENGRYSSEKYSITVFHDPVETLNHCLGNKTDILFLDIDMPIMSGFDIANVIREKNEEIKIIFVSAFENLVYTSFRYNPFRFIRKGYEDKELEEAFSAAVKEILYKEMFLTVTTKNETIRLLFSEIVMLESHRNYVEITTTSGETVRYRTTDIEKDLREYGFIRIHAGFIVSASKIKFFKNDSVEMRNGAIIKLSRKYATTAKDAFRKYLRNEV